MYHAISGVADRVTMSWTTGGGSEPSRLSATPLFLSTLSESDAAVIEMGAAPSSIIVELSPSGMGDGERNNTASSPGAPSKENDDEEAPDGGSEPCRLGRRDVSLEREPLEPTTDSMISGARRCWRLKGRGRACACDAASVTSRRFDADSDADMTGGDRDRDRVLPCVSNKLRDEGRMERLEGPTGPA